MQTTIFEDLAKIVTMQIGISDLNRYQIVLFLTTVIRGDESSLLEVDLLVDETPVEVKIRVHQAFIKCMTDFKANRSLSKNTGSNIFNRSRISKLSKRLS